MLSNNNRQRLAFICKRIATGQEVKFQDMEFAQKLAGVNTTAADMLKKARLTAQSGNMPSGGTSEFLRDLGLGIEGNPEGIRRFNTPDELADFFRIDRPDDWRQRD